MAVPIRSAGALIGLKMVLLTATAVAWLTTRPSTHFLRCRGDPRVAMLVGKRADRRHHRVERAEDSGGLRLRDRIDTPRLLLVIHLPRRHAVHAGFLLDGQERMFRATGRQADVPRLQ